MENKTKYKCPYDYRCILPRNDYRCNTAYEHCTVFNKFKVLNPEGLEQRVQDKIKEAKQ